MMIAVGSSNSGASKSNTIEALGIEKAGATDTRRRNGNFVLGRVSRATTSGRQAERRRR
jgi:hypothetical protein